MRRIKIFLYWLFKSRNNVSLGELIKFMAKPAVRVVASTFIEKIDSQGDLYEVTFKGMPRHLFWPKHFPIDGIYQVTAETFDTKDWHYYQKVHTVVESGEVIVDVGTAEGLLILNVIDRCKKVILIEPNDYFVQALKKSFSGVRDKVIIHNVACGAAPGEISFNSASLASKIDSEGVGGLRKKIDTIDRLTAAEPLITYLKADIEGFEIEMLKGAQETIRKHKPKLAITTYHPENDWQDIANLVRSYVPEYQYYVKGVFQEGGRPVMIHFWINKN